MAQNKTTTKRANAKRATAKSVSKKTSPKKTNITKGSTNLKTKSKFLNWKIIVPLIVIVAAVGGYFFVWQSDASSYTFIRRADQIKAHSKIGGKKVDGVSYKLLRNDAGTISGSVETLLSAAEARRSSRICAHFRVLKRITSRNDPAAVFISQRVPNVKGLDFYQFGHITAPRTPATVITNTTKSGNVCMRNHLGRDSVIEVSVRRSTPGNQSHFQKHQVGVDTIYGRP